MRGAPPLSWAGVRTVAVLELRQRVRSTRWVVALVVWFVVVGAITGGLIMAVINNGMSLIGAPSERVMLVKGLVLLAAVAYDVWTKRRVGIAR